MPRRIESLFIDGPAGKLEALLEEPEGIAAKAVALVCHPHPQHGGTMHNKVVCRIARGLRKAGAVVLRFNYRGVNLSEGRYDHGIGERSDAEAALATLRSRYPELPFVLAGFSFGSRIILKMGCAMAEDPLCMLAAGFPAALKDSHGLGHCPRLRVFIQSTHDEFSPVPAMQAYYNVLPGAKELVWVAASDHFFAGALEEFEAAVQRMGESTMRGHD